MCSLCEITEPCPVPAKVHRPLAPVKKVFKRSEKKEYATRHNSKPSIWPKKLKMTMGVCRWHSLVSRLSTRTKWVPHNACWRLTKMSGSNFNVIVFNVPRRISREWMHKHHLDEDKEFIMHEVCGKVLWWVYYCTTQVEKCISAYNIFCNDTVLHCVTTDSIIIMHYLSLML